MRTTLDILEDLINEAMKASCINTKTNAIVAVLEGLIEDRRLLI